MVEPSQSKQLPLSVLAFCLLFVAGSFPAVLAAEWAAWRHRNAATQALEAELQAVATGVTAVSHEYLEDQRRMAAITAATVTQLNTRSPDVLRPMLDAQATAADSIQGLYVAEVDGTPLVTSPAASPFQDELVSAGHDYFQQVLTTRDTAWSRVLRAPHSQQPIVVVAEPILDDVDTLRGVVGAAVNLKHLEQLVQAMASRDHMRILITDDAGLVVIDTSSKRSAGELLESPDMMSAACTNAHHSVLDEASQPPPQDLP